MKNIFTLISLPISLLAHIESIWSLINLITESKKKIKMEEHTSGYWIFQSISFITTVVFVTWVVMKFQKIYNRMEAISLINEYRTYMNFLSSSTEKQRLPNETEEEFTERSNESIYNKLLLEEKKKLTINLAHRLNINLRDSKKIMDDVYSRYLIKNKHNSQNKKN